MLMNNKFKARSLNRKSYRKFTMSCFSVTCFKHVGLLWPISALDRKQVRGYTYTQLHGQIEMALALWNQRPVKLDTHVIHWEMAWGFILFTWNPKTVFGCMMASSNGNILCVTGLLCGNSPVTGEFPWPGILLTQASDSELGCFLWSALVIWDAIALIVTPL